MLRIISWNINGKRELWRDAAILPSAFKVDVALLQEAPSPPEDFQINTDFETPWQTKRSGKSWRTAVASFSDSIQFNKTLLKSIENAERRELQVSRAGSLAVGTIILPETGETITLVSMYSVWENPANETGSSWIYADASAHRLISDISALIGSEKGHRIIAAGDLNLLYGYGDSGNAYWKGRYETVFARMEAIGLKFLGPQAPDGGIQADPVPLELPADSKNVPTFRRIRSQTETGTRQLDFVFASTALQHRIKVTALNKPEEWGGSDHCRILIELT